MRRLAGLLLLMFAAGMLAAAESGVPKELTQRLAQHVGDAIKAGEKPRAWVEVLGKKTEVALSKADEKSLTVLVQGNPFPLAWDRLSAGELVDIARAIAGDKGGRLLTAGELALVNNQGELAADLLAKAKQADPTLADKVDALAAKLPAAPVAPPKPATPAPAEPKTSASQASAPQATAPPQTVKLAPGWWKGLQVPRTGKVIATHPRLFVRDKPWGEGGLGLEQLRLRATQDPWKGWIPRFTGDPCNLAMKYLLTGDKAAADKAVEALLKKPSLGGDTDDGDELEMRCMAFDWLHGYAGFNDEAKKKAGEIIAATAEECIKRLNTGGPHVFHTRMYAWANGAVFAGIVLSGAHPKADEFLDYGYRYWREKLFPARWHQAGPWQNGFGYGRKFMCRSICFFLHAWRSATGEDLWKTVKTEQDDWIGAQLRFLVYAHRPDGMYPTFGDCYNHDDEKFSGGLAMMMAAGSRDPLAAWLAEKLHKKHGLRTVEDHWNIYPFLFFDPALPKQGPEVLPKSVVFGPQALGFAIMRGGWGPKDHWVFFKCGDYFENHGHFDQGHFEICCDKPLAVDSGTYAGFNSPHRLDYYRQSVASNTLLIEDSADAADTGCQRIVNFQGADTLETYFNHKSCESGNITDFRVAADHTIVVGDYAAAYDQAKVSQCTRMLVYFGSGCLVICDAVQTTKPSTVKVLLHYPTDAAISGPRAVIDNGASRLTCDAVWPENAKLSKVAGFVVKGRNLPPSSKPDDDDVGTGRLEVESAQPSASHLFVTVLHFGPKEKPADKAKAKGNGTEITVELSGRKLTFNAATRAVQVK